MCVFKQLPRDSEGPGLRTTAPMLLRGPLSAVGVGPAAGSAHQPPHGQTQARGGGRLVKSQLLGDPPPRRSPGRDAEENALASR